jgi:hypothetical protein
MFERVYTVVDYWDGPREGVADFQGRPHLFQAEWDKGADDDESVRTFLLRPISHKALEAALEDWTIWLRWEQAFHAGETTEQSHPALPEDRSRHEELEATFAAEVRGLEGPPLRAHGTFRPPLGVTPTRRPSAPMEVEWSVLPK